MRSWRWPLTLWVTLVLVLHAWAWWSWRDGLGVSRDPMPERLQLRLTRPMALQAPPPAPTLSTRKLAAPARSRPATLPLVPLPPPVTEQGLLPPLPERLPDLPPIGDGETDLGPEWPRSTRLRYHVTGHFRGPVHGDAEVEWLRQGVRYQVRLKLQIGPSLAPFASRELLSDGVITPAGISPRRYDESTRLLLGQPRRLTLQIDEQELRLANGRRLPAPPGVQDSASQFVHLAWLLLTERVPAEAGTLIELPLALPLSLQPWRYEIVGRERLESSIGQLDTWHLRPQGVNAPGALLAEVWLAPQLQYLPVQILIRQNEETWVQLTLREPPLQEEPEPENAASQPESSAP